MKDLFIQRRGLSADEPPRRLSSMNPQQLDRLFREGARQIRQHAQRMVYDALEQKLSEHDTSSREAEELLKRLRKG